MNKKQQENTAKMLYDLVKVPLAVCCFGTLTAAHEHMASFIFFGGCFSLLFFYMAYTMDGE